ncbi:MAG: ABC transporter substrate-binding protein [Caldilineaceae bacterium]|nr:ABC transporter substrate-binding protein [Caldilineaceae bacterium]
MSRLKVILVCLVFGALLISACTPAPAPAAEPAAAEPAAAQPAAAAPAPAEAAPAATTSGEIPRNRTMIVADFGPTYSSPEMWSPYNLGGTHQNGVALFHEPLVFADMLDGHQYPWLATSWEYNTDATELVYELRDGVTWSDGEKFSAEDVAYTLNTLRDLGNDVRLGGIYQTYIKEAVAVDDLTVKISFNSPSPRFHDEVVVAKGDSATFIVPKHIWEGQNWAEYTAFNDGAGPVTTSPWVYSFADDTRRVIDRVKSCDEWWACRTGFAALPEVERFVQIVIADQQAQATALIRNEIDQTHDLRVDLIEKILQDNPDATTWTGREGPYGMVSWWPTALHLSNTDKHFSKSEVRWAVNRYIDRDKLIDFAFAGNGQKSVWPFPPFKGLQASIDNLTDLEAKYQPDLFDPADGDARLIGAGYTKNADGIWADADGDTIKCYIASLPHFSDLGPVLVEMLKQGGIDTTFSVPPDAGAIMASGNYTCGMWGHNGAMSGNIYRTLLLYTTGDPGNWFQYSNAEFDAIVEELAVTADEAKVRELEHAAMDIWLRDLPDVNLAQFYNRTGNNGHYWTNWPSTATDPFMNGIHMHTGFPYTMMQLKATNAP